MTLNRQQAGELRNVDPYRDFTRDIVRVDLPIVGPEFDDLLAGIDCRHVQLVDVGGSLTLQIGGIHQ